MLDCFRGKRDQTRGYLLSRQVGCPLHHWCHAIPVEVLEYDNELDENESIRSRQKRNILSFKKSVDSHMCLLCVCQVGSQKNKKWDHGRIINEVCLDIPTQRRSHRGRQLNIIKKYISILYGNPLIALMNAGQSMVGDCVPYLTNLFLYIIISMSF